MKRRIIPLFVLIIALILVLIPRAGQVEGRSLSAPISTAFTYQGKLMNGSSVANGVFDLTFTLYDAPGGGSQVGSTLTLDDISVVNGLFTVQLDFGAVFDGNALYLEIGVRPGSGGSFVTLNPRQELTAAPYARHAEQVSWNGITNIPAGFADGTDDGSTYTAGTGLTLNSGEFALANSFRLPQACSNGQIAQWNGTGWECNTQNAYSAGTGLSLTGGQMSLNGPYQLPQTCSNGQIAQWNGSGWVCANDNAAIYTAGSGIIINSNQVSASYAGTGGDYGTAGTLARSDHTHPTGTGTTAGGDLTGTYPNPDIAANAVGSAEIADGSVDMADTRNWIGFGIDSAMFLAGTGNPDLYIWGQAFTPSANGSCLVIANAFITSTGYAEDDPQPALDLAIDRGGSVSSDPYVDIPFSPQDVNTNEDLTASNSYVWSVNAGQATRFGCLVSDPDGDWDTDEVVRCRISYICQ